MPAPLALVLAWALVAYAFYSERKRGLEIPRELLLPTLWYLVVSSRPFGVWLVTWGVPLPGGGDPSEGSMPDRWFYLILTILGFRILLRRKFDWGGALRSNRWVAALLVFMALSVMWSEYPFTSFKRYIKVVGSMVMAFVVLTNDRPFEAILTVLRRCLYIHLPMSIICAKYYRDIGVAYDFTGSAQMWQGISTSKNVLGQVAMLGVIYFLWELMRNWRRAGFWNLHGAYLVMALYLLKGSPSSVSMTSVSVCAFAVMVFLRLHSLRERLPAAGTFIRTVFFATVGLITLVLTHSVAHFTEESLFGQLITKFGRDITLTDRTFIWSDVYAAAARNPLLGVGFGGFWIGREANIPWNSTMTWVLGQAHSGYVDTYLQVGAIGSLLLAGTILNAPAKLIRILPLDFEFAVFRITVLLTIVFVNITETTFLRGDHHLWFMMQLSLWVLPNQQQAVEGSFEAALDEPEPAAAGRNSSENEPGYSARI